MNKNTWLLLTAILGSLITGYLNFSYFNDSVPFCGVEQLTGCSTVVTSHYSKIGFVPVAFASFISWLLLLFCALLLRSKYEDVAKKIAFVITIFGVAAAGYFNGIMFFRLGAFCSWCESAHFLMLLNFLMYANSFFNLRRITKSVASVAVLFFVPFGLTGSDNTDADTSELAFCLAEKNVIMYGAYWCPHCKEQKELFGDSFEKVKYVECADPVNPRQQTKDCISAGINNYPTWINNKNERVTGTQSLEFLKSWVDC